MRFTTRTDTATTRRDPPGWQPEAGHATPTRSPPVNAEQHALGLSVLLHLAPGAALTAFVIAANAALGLEPLLGLLVGILVVLAPLELGYLALYAHRATGSWSPLAAADYRARVPWKRLSLTAAALAVWMLGLVAVSLVVIDEWLAESVFAWLPEAIVTMATVEGGEQTMSTGALVAFLLLFFMTNGVVGPLTEELYFRGHLLPRIDRYGRAAPVLNTVLFTLYHFHTPWRWPVIFLGYLPICIASWRNRSLWIGLGAHVLVNNIFVLMMLASYLAQ